MFNIGDRVERVGKSWGNIGTGALGTVREVMDFGKKLRVRFDDYESEKDDGTVIVLAKTMRQAQVRVTLGSILKNNPIYEDDKVIVNAKAPIRGDPFDANRMPRVVVTSGRISGKAKPLPTVEHVDLTVPFHKQQPPRPPDYLFMADHNDNDDLEGLVGEGIDEEKQEDAAWEIDQKLERAAAAPKQEMSARARVRPLLPFTAWENEMRKRRLFPSSQKEKAIQNALDKAFAVSALPNK